jgi:hypothetical protein
LSDQLHQTDPWEVIPWSYCQLKTVTSPTLQSKLGAMSYPGQTKYFSDVSRPQCYHELGFIPWAAKNLVWRTWLTSRSLHIPRCYIFSVSEKSQSALIGVELVWSCCMITCLGLASNAQLGINHVVPIHGASSKHCHGPTMLRNLPTASVRFQLAWPASKCSALIFSQIGHSVGTQRTVIILYWANY